MTPTEPGCCTTYATNSWTHRLRPPVKPHLVAATTPRSTSQANPVGPTDAWTLRRTPAGSTDLSEEIVNRHRPHIVPAVYVVPRTTT